VLIRSTGDFFQWIAGAILAAWIEFLPLAVLRIGGSAVSLPVRKRRKGWPDFRIYLDDSP
jgi:hypothetical protein